MFTGIVQALVCVLHVERDGNLMRMSLDLGEYADRLQLGASVAVNGTCLTVTRVEQGQAHFDIIAETTRITTLGQLEPGTLVNIERSFQAGEEVGGHIVSGHITCTAQLVDQKVEGHDHVLRFALDPQWQKYFFHKGFIALDGASLTVSSIDRDAGTFEVSLIPETLQRTTLGQISMGESVNVEVDSQTVTTVDTVERMFSDEDLVAKLVAGATSGG